MFPETILQMNNGATVMELSDALEKVVAAEEAEKKLEKAIRAGTIRRYHGIDYHPACTCRMGPSSDSEAVVDASGKVHGLDGLYICDASIFPTLMRANTNLPAAMVAEKLAGVIGGMG